MTSTTDPPATETLRQSRRLSRYVLVTAVATPLNLFALAVLLATTSWHPTICNIVAASAVTVPTYLACLRWVWPFAGREAGRAAAFWASSMLNVATASTVVWMLEHHDVSRARLLLVPNAVYAVLWAGRFLVLDRLVFTSSTTRATNRATSRPAQYPK